MAKGTAFLGGIISFLFGIFAASSGWSFYITEIWFLVCVFFGIRVWFSKIELRQILKFLAILFISLAAGFFYYNFYFNFGIERQNIAFSQKIDFSGIVSGEPVFSEKFQKFEVTLDRPLRGKIVVLVSLSPKFDYGDKIGFSGTIESPTETYLNSISFFPSSHLIKKHQGLWIKEKLLNFKQNQIAVFRKLLGQDEAALISGITFGFRGDFTNEFKARMSQSGTTHIVALSGYNIAILVAAIFFVFNRYISRRKTFYLTAGIIFFFVMMVGAEASVVRAAIMGFLVLLGREIGRPNDGFRILVLTALVMALFNPSVLHFDIGFQLSFLSLMGILYLEPILKMIFRLDKKTPSFFGWRENAVSTFSAQLFVAPILIQSFGQFSLTSILANVLILEVVPLTMFFGFLLSFLGSILLPLGFLIAKLASILLWYQIEIIKIFSQIRIPIGGTFISYSIVVIYYALLVGFIIFKTYGKKIRQS